MSKSIFAVGFFDGDGISDQVVDFRYRNSIATENSTELLQGTSSPKFLLALDST
ncbi:hypothetical protein ROA7745_03770 [Roseovarius aestuarii]|uniref:Uncharacterized protein n=1 Tax=Roseovarius aestuarii TaxID=475083 RepID=A0A1X7BW92_9RHOB|nr:hypothetical protein ROA7745_03770 [Roseovarius aestuarii]